MKIKNLLILLTIIGGLSVPIFSQNLKQSYKSIQEDIEIMETILDKLFCKEKGSMMFFSSGTNGYYLDDYGVLFKVPYSMQNLIRFNDNYKQAMELYISKKNELITTGTGKKKATKEPNSEEKFNKELIKIKDTLTRFLGDYASAINYLKPKHWVTVIIDFNSSSRWFDALHKGKKINQLIAKVQIKDINAYRKRNIDLERFKQKIQYTSKSNGDSAMEEDVDIFSDIIQSFLERNEKQIEFNLSEGVKGIYLNGYGAIFMLKANMEPNILKVISSSDGKNNFSIQTISSDDDAQEIGEKINNMKGKIITLLSRFGHTMRKLDDKEWLEIALRINVHDFDEDFSKYIMKIKKKDLDELNVQRINMDEFKQRIRIIKY